MGSDLKAKDGVIVVLESWSDDGVWLRHAAVAIDCIQPAWEHVWGLCSWWAWDWDALEAGIDGATW